MKDVTKLVSGRHGHKMERLDVRTVNPSINRGSTYLYDNMNHMSQVRAKARELGTQSYGINGGDITVDWQEAFCELENGFRGVAVSSGLLACTAPLLALLGEGDHLLMIDTVYGPVRTFCDNYLPRIGVSVTYYDPLCTLDELDRLRTPATRVLYLETPGSVTFEMQDIPALAPWAKDRGLRTIIDNTWGTGLYFKPLDHGVDISTHAATKYMCGHSDVVSGAIVCNEETVREVEAIRDLFGLSVAPDEIYMGLRGLRTMAIRLPVHWHNGLALANHLKGLPEVANVLHPALEQDPGHALWQRDFTGASGLFSVVLSRDVSWEQVDAFLRALKLYGLGYSWGGFESLCAPHRPQAERTGSTWPRPGIGEGFVLRFHAGLEDPGDLIADIDQALHAMKKV